jgi:PadR family transcriptional regulator PadR
MADSGVGQYVHQLLRGVVEPLMLYIIGELPSHGYRIAKEIERRSSGYFTLTASTVYSALRRLEEEGLVLSKWQDVASSQRRRCYYLTEKGREMLNHRVAEWRRFSDAAEQVMASD